MRRCLCYSPASPQLDPWCSGPTCQPVTLEIAGSNPVGSAINAFSYAPSARPDGAFLRPARPGLGGRCPVRNGSRRHGRLAAHGGRARGLRRQARVRPHIILDKAQPNFLDPAGDGKVVLSGVYGDLLPW